MYNSFIKSNTINKELSTGEHGSINACKACSGLDCCGLLKAGGIIEPPYLLKKDIENIEFFTGLPSETFALKKLNIKTGNYVYIMKINESGGCVFFNYQTGLCNIYNCRPVDCRLFPLDIRYINNHFYWALFKYPKCNKNISNDIKKLENFKTEALEIIDDELLDYSTIPVPGMEKVGYTFLEEINQRDTKHECNDL